MTKTERNRIIYKTGLAWEIINEMKQDKLNATLIMSLRKYVPELTGNAVCLLTEPIFEPQFQVDENIEALKIPRAEIIAELIKNRLLPDDFYQL